MCGADIPAKRTMNRIFDKLTIEKKLCIRPKTSENYVIKQVGFLYWKVVLQHLSAKYIFDFIKV